MRVSVGKRPRQIAVASATLVFASVCSGNPIASSQLLNQLQRHGVRQPGRLPRGNREITSRFILRTRGGSSIPNEVDGNEKGEPVPESSSLVEDQPGPPIEEEEEHDVHSDSSAISKPEAAEDEPVGSHDGVETEPLAPPAVSGPSSDENASVAAAAAAVAEASPQASLTPATAVTSSSPAGPVPKNLTETWTKTRILKYVSFVLLVVQNSALTCTMRWSRARAAPGPLYCTSTAVVMSEVAKMVVSSLLLLQESGSWSAFTDTVHTELIGKPDECLKLLVPGLLYTLQNNLQYVAASNLEPAVFQVMYQVKMLTTAVLSVTMLKKQLRPNQWGGVGLLMAGLVLVQLSQRGALAATPGGGGGNLAVGFSAVLSACTLAGFAGCYLERVLKGSATSLWVRNLQLGAWGTLLGALSVVAKDGTAVRRGGFFQGYSPVVWAVVGIQACGGLLISLVVRYGDALLKGFATGLAIILTTVVSVAAFGFQVTPQYLAGASTVFFAVLLYSGILPKLAARLQGEAEDDAGRDRALPSGYPWSRVALGGSSAAINKLLLLGERWAAAPSAYPGCFAPHQPRGAGVATGGHL